MGTLDEPVGSRRQRDRRRLGAVGRPEADHATTCRTSPFPLCLLMFDETCSPRQAADHDHSAPPSQRPNDRSASLRCSATMDDGSASSAPARSTTRPSTTRRVPSWRRQLPALLAVLVLAGAWLPLAAAAASCSEPGLVLEPRAVGGTSSRQLSPRPTPSRASKPLAERIKTNRTRPLPKVAYVRAGGQPTVRRSADVARRAGEAACLAPGTTAAEINALFASKGTGAGVLDLCPGTVYLVEETIFFTAAGQGLRTLGGAAVARSQRAELRIASADISTAIHSMNCVGCDNILVSDLRFNGSRTAYGPLAGGEALIELGGSSKGHSVLRTKIFDTRGWSSLHFMCGSRSRAASAPAGLNLR